MDANFDPFKEYQVVLSIEDQYSIWPTRKPIPLGWEAVGKIGTKDECLSYIKEVWVDMRPKTVKEIDAQRETLN